MESLIHSIKLCEVMTGKELITIIQDLNLEDYEFQCFLIPESSRFIDDAEMRDIQNSNIRIINGKRIVKIY